MRTIIILFLMCSVCYAQEINEKYSYNAFSYHGLSFKSVKAEEFNNSKIVGSCFYQEALEDATMLSQIQKDIFPDGMKGVIFDRCNLDNVYVDKDNNIVLSNCAYRKIKVQNDWDAWVLDDDLKPVEPMNKEQRLKHGISIDPKDIPEKKWTEEERNAFEKLFNPDAVINP